MKESISTSKPVAVMNLKEMVLVAGKDGQPLKFSLDEAKAHISTVLEGQGEVVNEYFDEEQPEVGEREPSDEELDNMEGEEDIEPDTENDVFYQDYGHLGSNGGFFYNGKEVAKTDEELKAWMKKEGYYPSVWYVSDHGNISPYSLDEASRI